MTTRKSRKKKQAPVAAPPPPLPPPEEPLMNTKDAAQYLRVTRNTLYLWIKQGRLPVIRMAKQILRFRRKDLEEFVKSFVVEKTAPPVEIEPTNPVAVPVTPDEEVSF